MTTAHTENAYETAARRAVEDREAFWLEAAEGIDWDTKPTRALDDSRAPLYRWFPDGELNVCYNALDRHVEAGRGEDTALIYDSPVTDSKQKISYRELTDTTARFAKVLQDKGVEKGDRVIIYMPMIPQAVVAMLACARIGAVHSVVFGGFSARELAVRINDLKPKAIVSASGGIEPSRKVEYKPMVDAALDEVEHVPALSIVYQRDLIPAEVKGENATTASGAQYSEYSFDELMEQTPTGAAPVAIKATDELYVLYTSGTTGKPKGIVRDAGGYAVALTWSMKNLYDLRPGHTIFCASDVGWVVGHSYIVYAPLLSGVTTIVFEGKPVGVPDAGTFFRVVDEYDVRLFYGAPTAMRVIRKEDPEGELMAKYPMRHLRAWIQAGERLDPETYKWTTEKLAEATGRDIPVFDNWWQTETGWPIAANPIGLHEYSIKPGSPAMAVPGYDVRVVDAAGNEMEPGEEGLIIVSLPLPPGTLATVWGDDERYVDSYLSSIEGAYLTGDGGCVDEDGYVYVMGRTDDVINVAGHRLSAGALEAAVASHPAVAECAVIGLSDPVKGQIPRALVVLKAGHEDVDHAALEKELVAQVRVEVGPVAALKSATVVEALPKTRSGKILRKTMREIAEGKADAAVPSTIEDVAVLDAIRPSLRQD